MTGLEITAPDGTPEVEPGDDLVAIVLLMTSLADGDVLVVTSKVVSKAEGRLRRGSREDALPGETTRVVARRGETAIVRNRLGLTMAAAGIDNSNVPLGQIVLLPEDPDGTARALRDGIREQAGVNVAVIISDTAGRAWREGQTDIAIGAAGLVVAEDFAGRTDAHGNELAVTLPAVADELAGAAELATGKLGGRPFAVVRGRADLVLAPGDHGPGAASLIRPDGADLFGYGAREAVVRALRAQPADQRPFGAPAPPAELAAVIRDVVSLVPSHTGRADGSLMVTCPRGLVRALTALTFAHGWTVNPTDHPNELRLRPASD
ncbi:F420-dependent oxidoreductase [Nocardioides sp. Root1257]|uniref:coenzyme F420-0:L-glutamate ligase n=1 Tax=unclassified Nocardioides TaxID=2615069 RepID=UPI0006F61616|nr:MULTISPECIES: coenzyme F420-0:L-glutamate ligase [unclassified Nocardioides]KQW49415.1 F420-dependent oxidoreductase [Nocardioides sp. Root1257]KRC48589.1 F420-dependent oxidoreductase [Nocardioides sp. Root224]